MARLPALKFTRASLERKFQASPGAYEEVPGMRDGGQVGRLGRPTPTLSPSMRTKLMTSFYILMISCKTLKNLLLF